MIAAAKKDKINISFSVTPYHLFFCEDDLHDYDTHLKVNPPLRSKKDRDALRKGVKNGLVDCIASHHQPQDWDHKVCEFEYAGNGMETLESVFGAVRSCGISAESFVSMQTERIHDIFNTEKPSLSVGSKANLTLFNPTESFIFQQKDIFSKSKNNAFLGKELSGRIIGIINRGKIFLK
jgi:dihydroorotase